MQSSLNVYSSSALVMALGGFYCRCTEWGEKGAGGGGPRLHHRTAHIYFKTTGSRAPAREHCKIHIRNLQAS